MVRRASTRRLCLGGAVAAVLAAAPAWAGDAVKPYYHAPIEVHPPNPARLGYFGMSLATAGDVDGDGHADVIVGAPGIEDYSEAVVVFGPDFRRAQVLEYPRRSTAFGSAVCGLGDIDGDGRSELLVGQYNSGGVDGRSGGEVFVYPDGPDGHVLARTAPQPELGNDFGFAAACVGDVNGDGVPDALVGAPRGGQDPRGGKAHLLFGPLFTASRSLQPPEPAPNLFGAAVAPAGDVDGQGGPDLLVGAPYTAVDGVSQAGTAYVFLGPDHQQVRVLRAPVPAASAELGISVAGVGDTNGDGFDDVLVGSRRSGAYLFLGPTFEDVLPLPAPPGAGLTFGEVVAAIGDLDGDGLADLFTSDHERNTAYVFRGTDMALLWSYTLTENPDHWAESIAGAGDLNDDGLPDLLVGMRRACVPKPGVEGAGPRAPVCGDEEEKFFAEAGLAKVILSTAPKIESPVEGRARLALSNVHPAGSSVAVRLREPEGGGSLELAQVTDGGVGDLDAAADGRITLELDSRLERGMRLQAENLTTRIRGREFAVLPAVPATGARAVLAALVGVLALGAALLPRRARLRQRR
jgi:hypothetical protein